MKKSVFFSIVFLVSLALLGISAKAYSQTLSGSTSHLYNNSVLAASFQTDSNAVMGTFFTNYKVTHEGHSYSRWYGYTPYLADSILQNDRFYWNGIGGLTITLGTSGSGIGVSTDNTSVTFSLSVEDARRLDHYYYDVKGNRWIIDGTGQSIGTTFQFGTTFISIGASDSNIVW